MPNEKITFNLGDKTISIGQGVENIVCMAGVKVIKHRQGPKYPQRTTTVKVGCKVPWDNKLGIYPPDYLDTVACQLDNLVGPRDDIFWDVSWRPRGYANPFLTFEFWSNRYDVGVVHRAS